MNSELGLRARERMHHLFHDRSMVVMQPDCEVRGDTLDGFFYANTRVLSRFALRVAGHTVEPVQTHPARDDLLIAYYHDPRITDDAVLQDRALLVQVTIAVADGFHVDIDARNHSLAPLRFELGLLLDADFADTEETRRGADASKILPPSPGGGPVRLQTAPVHRACMFDHGAELRFDYGHAALHEAVVLRFDPPPRCAPDGVAWTLALEPQASWHACVTIAPTHEGIEVRPPSSCYGDSVRGDDPRVRPWQREATRLETSNDSVRRTYERAVQDLGALALDEGIGAERDAFAAGIPIYHNRFGRDLLTTGWQAMLATPALLESAILVCERYQGRVRDDVRDEQPGRIIQQVRSGPLNLLNLNPRGRYYSDYASPEDFLIMVGQQFMWGGDREQLRAHLPAARRVLAWLDRDADLDDDGLYEYRTRSRMGDRNQGWKDSERAIPHADGSDAPLPIATCEVQGYVYVGKQQLGAALLALGRVRDGIRLLREAAALRERFNHAFWQEDLGCIAMALDGAKRPVRSIGSNAGHCLAAGIVEPAHAAATVGRLMAPDMFSGWGVRTLSAEHSAYNPFSYHLGSVWTVEQGTIAFGMKRYGFGVHAQAIARGSFDLAERYQLHRLPEAVGGHPRDRQHPFPGIYPQACWPQAWSSGAVIMLLQALLGLRPMAPLGVLLVYPELPEWLPDVTLRGLRVGGSRLSLRFRRREDGYTEHRVLERQGRIRVLREPPESSLHHSTLDRIFDPLRAALTAGL